MIKIVSVGKVKDVSIESLISEYRKRLSRYVKIEEIIIKEEKIKPDTKEEEGKRILERIGRISEIVYCLDEKGTELSSVEFSSLLKRGDACFVIGGFSGLSDEVKKGRRLFSLSRMTLTHEMAQLFLYEQIYRGYTIIHNQKYHKA